MTRYSKLTALFNRIPDEIVLSVSSRDLDLASGSNLCLRHRQGVPDQRDS